MKLYSQQQTIQEEAPEHVPLHDTTSNAYSNSYSDEEAFSPKNQKRKLITVKNSVNNKNNAKVLSDPIEAPKAVISDMWRDRDAERLANWANEDCRLRKANSQKLMPNGTERGRYRKLSFSIELLGCYELVYKNSSTKVFSINILTVACIGFHAHFSHFLKHDTYLINFLRMFSPWFTTISFFMTYD